MGLSPEQFNAFAQTQIEQRRSMSAEQRQRFDEADAVLKEAWG